MFPLPAHRFHNVSNQRQETRTYNNGSNTVTTRRMNHVYERTSSASNCEVLTNRGFKPSDRRDPQKREFLINLSKKICHLVMKHLYIFLNSFAFILFAKILLG